MKEGKLYVVGVGPGDPELLTIKAVRILGEVRCIMVPKGREEGVSLARSIAGKLVSLDDKEVVEAYFPMRKSACAGQRPERDPGRDGIVEAILARLKAGIDVAFLTIGDPAIYSTFFYLYDRLLELDPGLDMEMVPGISSINAAASRATLSLGLADGTIAIVPATYTDNLKEVVERFDTVVLMKVYKVFNKVRALLEGMGLMEDAVFVSRAGMENEQIVKDISGLKEEDMDYFSLVIVRK